MHVAVRSIGVLDHKSLAIAHAESFEAASRRREHFRSLRTLLRRPRQAEVVHRLVELPAAGADVRQSLQGVRLTGCPDLL